MLTIGLKRVHSEQWTMQPLTNLLQRLEHSNFIVDHHDGGEGGVWADGPLKVLQDQRKRPAHHLSLVQ